MTTLLALPNEVLLSSLYSRFPCRDQQVRTVATLLSVQGPLARNVVLYGLRQTGKSAILKAVLESLSSRTSPKLSNGKKGELSLHEELQYAIVKSAESITGRHLLEQTIGAVAASIEWEGNVGRCESLAQLVVELRRLLGDGLSFDMNGRSQRKFVLVFDGIDRQRDPPSTLLPALARLGEIIPNLTIVFIVNAPRPNFLHLHGVPHINFPPYKKFELLQILSLIEPTPQLPSGTKDTEQVWSRFCTAVYDSLTKHADRDILSFRTVCTRLWPHFVRPILDGIYAPNQFSRLLVANRSLFQNETILAPNIVSTINTDITSSDKAKEKPQEITTQLPYYSRLLLVAAYLASFNPPRSDVTIFMKAAASKRKKRGGGTAKTRPGVSKSRKISRNLLGPQIFLLERLFAIFHAIREEADGRGRFSLGRGKSASKISGGADIMMAIATLVSLRLLLKLGTANAGDTMDGSSRYRVAVGWETVRAIARSVGIEAEDYLAE